jgi:hypothetical protein
MPYFQNVFNQEFRGNWVVLDSSQPNVPSMTLRGNLNTSVMMMAFTQAPFDLSVDKILTINYAIDPTLMQFQAIDIDVSAYAADTTQVQAFEVVNALNANAIFASLFTAANRPYNKGYEPPNVVYFQAIRQNTAIKAYIANTGAEMHMHFNAKAPIGQLPTFYERHTIGNRFIYPDGLGILYPLDPNVTYDASLISAAGMDPTNPLPDWQLLRGRAQGFKFSKSVFDGSGRVTSTVEYSAGALVGDMATLTQNVYTGGATVPSQTTTIPYLLTQNDLVTPPPL